MSDEYNKHIDRLTIQHDDIAICNKITAHVYNYHGSTGGMTGPTKPEDLPYITEIRILRKRQAGGIFTVGESVDLIFNKPVPTGWTLRLALWHYSKKINGNSHKFNRVHKAFRLRDLSIVNPNNIGQYFVTEGMTHIIIPDSMLSTWYNNIFRKPIRGNTVSYQFKKRNLYIAGDNAAPVPPAEIRLDDMPTSDNFEQFTLCKPNKLKMKFGLATYAKVPGKMYTRWNIVSPPSAQTLQMMQYYNGTDTTVGPPFIKRATTIMDVI
jgi:hypothetical protein